MSRSPTKLEQMLADQERRDAEAARDPLPRAAPSLPGTPPEALVTTPVVEAGSVPAAPPAAPLQLLTTRKFSVRIRDATVDFKPGVLVDSPTMIAQLLANKAPVVEVRNEDDLVACPHCQLMFMVDFGRRVRDLLRAGGRRAA